MFKMVNQNLKQHKNLEDQRSLERAEYLKEMQHIQTSLHSKKYSDQVDRFRKNLRQEKLMNVTSTNHGLQAEVFKVKEEKKEASSRQEKEWVNSIVEM